MQVVALETNILLEWRHNPAQAQKCHHFKSVNESR
jgi:hypothetical protein